MAIEKIIVMDKKNILQEVRVIKSPFIIGRENSCDLKLDDDSISRRHAQIIKEDGKWMVQDMLSGNGTMLDGVRISKEKLKNSSEIAVGRFLLIFKLSNTTSSQMSKSLNDEDITEQKEVKQNDEGLTVVGGFHLKPEQKEVEQDDEDLTVVGGFHLKPEQKEVEQDDEDLTVVGGFHLKPEQKEVEQVNEDQTVFYPLEKKQVLNGILSFVDGPLKGTDVLLDKKELKIGRSKDNDIQINQDSISRYHAKISVSEGVYFITDLGSKNGIFVNGKRVSEQYLDNGSKIKIGTTVSIFSDGEGDMEMVGAKSDKRNIMIGVGLGIALLGLIIFIVYYLTHH